VGSEESHNEIGVRELLNLFMLKKWVIFSSSLVAGVLFFLHAVSIEPIYYGDSVIQVEVDKPGLSGLSDLSEFLPPTSSLGAELEIIKSRSVLGGVVDTLGLRHNVTPRYFPLVGRTLSGSELFLEPPRVFSRSFLSKYDWGGENVDLQVKALTEQREAVYLRATIESDGQIKVEDRGSGQSWVLAEGESKRVTVGGGAEIVIYARVLDADPGSIYLVEVLSKLSAVSSLAKRVRVIEVGRDTGVMKLSMQAGSPERIENVLDAIGNAYLRQNIERRSAEAQQSLNFLNEQLPSVRGDLEAAENRLARFRELNQTIDLSIETESVLDKIVSVEKSLSELELKRSELYRTYTPDHPLVRTLNDQRSLLQDERDELESQSNALPDVQQELLRNLREVEVSTDLYTYMLNKIQELKVVQAGTVGNARIVDTAAASHRPVGPNRKIRSLLGGLVGLVVSATYIIFRRLFRVGISDPEVVEKTLDLPVYAVLPYTNLRDEGNSISSGSGLVTSHSPDSIISESFRSLRTSLHFNLGNFNRDGAATVIGFSGPAPNVGKTFVAANVAYTLSDSGRRVLFVDCDLRRGDSHSLFEMKKNSGMSECLVAGETGDRVKRFKESNLYVLTRGSSPPNPAELLMTSNFKKLVESWRKEYDYIVIDPPPALAVTDPVILSKNVDCLYLVGRAGVSQMHELIECKTRFTRGGRKIDGVIINGMTESLAAAGAHGYGYGYYNYAYSSEGN